MSHWIYNIIIKHPLLVCRTSDSLPCNVHGTIQCPTHDSPDNCVCRQGYRGNLCQHCEENCLLIDNSLHEGEIDPASGAGVVCSCMLP